MEIQPRGEGPTQSLMQTGDGEHLGSGGGGGPYKKVTEVLIIPLVCRTTVIFEYFLNYYEAECKACG